MPATLNALRRFISAAGCIEARVLYDPSSASIFIEFRCLLGVGRSCRAVLAVDRRAPWIPDRVLSRVGRDLAPCLGRGWHTRIPDEDPFG
jgi:hypothetical protein